MSETKAATNMTTTQILDVGRIEQPEAARLAEAEVTRMADALRLLTPAEWSMPTACTLWDVRAMAGHVLGMTETFSGIRPFVTTMWAGRKAAGDGEFIDGLTAVQVRNTEGLTTAELITRLAQVGPVAARWRGRRRLMRRIPLQQGLRDGSVESWRLAYLVDVVLTRDTWMHRSDLAEATGRPMELTAEHDGRLVADVVAEWAQRHGQPFRLRLTGPAGGDFVGGEGGAELTLDAVEFCRILGGRAPAHGLLETEVPF